MKKEVMDIGIHLQNKRLSILKSKRNFYIKSGDVLDILRKSLAIIDKRLMEHGDRVTYIIHSMLTHGGKLEKYNLEVLMALSTFHDIGAEKIDEIDEMIKNETEEIMKHSIYGYLVLKHLSPLGEFAEAILYHHMSYEKLIKTKCVYKSYAQLIYLVDRIDVERQNSGGKVSYENLRARKGTKFDPDLVEIFIRADESLGIINKCNSGEYRSPFYAILHQLKFTSKELLSYLEMMVFIIDFVSGQTATHTINTTIISMEIAKLMNLSRRDQDIISYSTFLHDIGKIAIPTNILESPDKLSVDDMEIMRTHVSITDQILKGSVPDEMRHIAARHHEKLDGSGYPKGLTAKELSMPERIVAVADIFSALIGVRSYKSALPKEKVTAIILEMRDKGLLDRVICDLAMDNYDQIVQVASKSQRFVMEYYDTIFNEYEELSEKLGLI